MVCAEIAEETCLEIFERLESLRSGSTTKIMKHRALMDLFSELKAQGISHLKSQFPSELRQSLQLFNAASPLSQEVTLTLTPSASPSPSLDSNPNYNSNPNPNPIQVLSDLAFSSKQPDSLFETADSYFYRNISELQQLRF